jgi:4-amino-4-deoxy-L-arabinose transferase-like glycosyltransferase
MVMAAGMAVVGVSIENARWISVVAASFSAPLMFLLARRFMPHGVAVLAGVGCAVYPTLAEASRHAESEAYFVPLLLLASLLSTRAYDSRLLKAWLIAGVAWGLAALVRPHAAPMAGMIAVYLLWRVGWRPAVVLAAGTFLCLLPWVVRNQLVLGHPVLLATESGETLLGANNPYVLADPKLHGMWISPVRVAEYAARLRLISDEVDRNEAQVSMAVDYLKANPEVVPRLVFYKLLRWLTPIPASGGMNRVIVLSSYGVLLALLGAGAFLGVYRNTYPLHQALLCTFVLLVVTAVYWGGLTRGRLPLEILWIPWAAASVRAMGPRLSSAARRWIPRWRSRATREPGSNSSRRPACSDRRTEAGPAQ